MEWKPDKDRPICPQLCEQVCVYIANGTLVPNQRMLSVRELAVAAGVNPNTVQHAFTALEEKGILYSVRGSGWFVGEDITAAKETVRELQQKKTAEYFEAMQKLGFDAAATKALIKEWEV